MLQCNSINNDESTFLILKIDWVFVGNWVLRHIKKNAKGSAESIFMQNIHFPLSFPDTSGEVQ